MIAEIYFTYFNSEISQWLGDIRPDLFENKLMHYCIHRD